MHILIRAALLATLALAGCSPPPYNNVGNASLKDLLAEGVPLYDIRRPEEWRQTGVLEGSRRLTYVDAGGRENPEILPRILAEVAKDAPIAIICRTGNRTDALARKLAEQGYTRIYNVQDGILGWMRDGNPVSRDWPATPRP